MPSTLFFDCRFRYPAGFTLDVTFESSANLIALFGPSGSGKTTVLSLVAGLLRPEEGVIQLRGETLADTKTGVRVPPERRRVGMLFQDHCLFPHLRVRANIEYGARRRPTEGVNIDQIIATLELGDLVNRFPQHLSGGQQQRVALARAIASSPRILLLDEPLTAVEWELRDRIAELIQRVNAEFHIPAVLVSHNRALVDRLVDHVVL
ncbi:MAG: ATP-binding cassette domain-containing protein, partial [Planctomycetales bacterium]|nr:ATP-binding cassette domain-containing protein [Planctomycetales bacterium]